jgi:thiol-disulfide isomerase/thioredoxin
LDRNDDPRVRLNFNITMMDLKCDFAVVDVVSVLGTDQNVTAHITKWQVDAGGVRRRYQGRNKQQKDIALFDKDVTETIEELHEDGEDAISLDAQTFEFIKRANDYVFVDFYATWCSHCKALAPTWEALAEVMDDVAEDNVKGHRDDYTPEDFEEAKKVERPVVIAKVDCVTHPELCTDIRAYPTLRLFIDGEPWLGDYRGPRTLLGMIEWVQMAEEIHKEAMDSDQIAKRMHAVHEGMLKPCR